MQTRYAWGNKVNWFDPKINDAVKTHVAQVVAVYVERSHLCHQLLSVRPNVTDMEVAVLWACAWSTVNESRSHDDPSNESLDALHDVTLNFLHSFFQGYISVFCQSSLKLDPESQLIRARITPTMEAMSPERLQQTGKIAAAVLSNSTKLAGSTIDILSDSLSQKQGQAATKYALSLVANDSTLKPFQQEEVQGWITGVSWVTAS